LIFERDRLTDLAAKAVVVTLFTLLSVNLLGDFVRTRRTTGLLLLVSESSVVVLTLVRRRARLVDRSPRAVLAASLSMLGPQIVRSSAGPGIVPDLTTTVISAMGLLVIIAAKLTLGRSFGVIPANRGVVVSGPYGIVRHPIYAGYLVTHVAFACAYPTAWNLLALAASDTALIVRALYEERVLAADRTYQSYCERVHWHLVPGVF
jgi:protein-S-isoprenylcysteine O-methyltransferase Ste14